MRAVVVGSGGREHALAWALSHSAEVTVTPGSDGIAADGIFCTTTPATELDADLFVIGPEAPLVAGLADALRAQGKNVFGPGRDGAELEGSKAFMKDFLAEAGVPSARYGTFTDVDDALAFLDTMSPPFVIKTDGLAAGKGVLVTNDLDAAVADVRSKLSGASFGSAGETVIIEEGLSGDELSLMVITDGERAVALVPAQDFKRVGDNDEGPNTGGMGAYAPLPHYDDATNARIMDEIVAPTLATLRARGISYRGVLFAGVMMTENGPSLLEYNVRFGDPESEVLALLYGELLAETLFGAATGKLSVTPAPHGAAVTVVMASHSYPEGARTGDVITGLNEAGQLADPLEGVHIFHAGTAKRGDHFVTNGGRVLMVSALADTHEAARALAYAAVDRITFDGAVLRRDIAARVGQ